MADLPALPTPGQKPWSLNPHITAMNAELNGRLSIGALNAGKPTLDVRDFGAVSDPATDNTTAINAAIAQAAATGATVLFPAGDYRCNGTITVPDYVILNGAGSFSRYGSQLGGGSSFGWRKTTVRLYRLSGSSTAPLIHLKGNGSGVQNLQIEGAGAPGTLLVTEGFETVIENVRLINGGGIGLDVWKANNTRWRNIYVDNCGSVTLPAVKIWSKSGTGAANETNTLDIYTLRIERSANVALDIAYNPGNLADPEYWAEFTRIFSLHIESNNENVGVGSGVGNTASLVRIGNVRSLNLIAPYIYGGPGYLIEHSQQYNRSYGNGGIKILGGTLLGSNDTLVAATPTLVNLINGDDFSLDGVRTLRHTSQTIRVASTYGEVRVSPTCYPFPTFNDLRAGASSVWTYGDAFLSGHIESRDKAPTLGGVSGVAPTLVGGSTDTAGKVTLATTTPPGSSGVICTVTFARQFAHAPAVVVSPGTPVTEAAGISATSTATGFTIRSTNPLAGSSAYEIGYAVIG